MQDFKVKIYLRIITTSKEEGKLLILLEENGESPYFILEDNSTLDEQLTNKLNSLFYENDMYLINGTKQVSNIEIDKNDQCLDIYFNFISPSTASKSGSFVIFDKKSMELYRLINNRGI